MVRAMMRAPQTMPPYVRLLMKQARAAAEEVLARTRREGKSDPDSRHRWLPLPMVFASAAAAFTPDTIARHC